MEDVTIVEAARAWARALAELELTKERSETEGDMILSAELAIHSAAARRHALRSAEHALYRAVRSFEPQEDRGYADRDALIAVAG